ncbi:MAG: hypothetical protein HKO98_07305 [Gemmatimonadetes bacterium]|nr:hypothetical protein [Gemmatimonadota bacterium]
MTASDLQGLIETLVRAHVLERALSELRPEGLPTQLRGPLPVSPGVQAALVASSRADGPDVLCLRRASPAAALAMGVTAVQLAHEALGSAAATAHGRDPGGVPIAVAGGLLGAVDPPGTMVEVMAGVAMALRMRNDPRVAILVDDADASASGYWHEGLNLAAVQRAPLVLVVDGSRRHALTAAIDRLSARAPAYGVHAVTVEGDTPPLVLEAIADAAARAREGGGTQLVEVVPTDEGDPLQRWVRHAPGMAESLEALLADAETETAEAVATAHEAGPPPRGAAAHPALWGGASAPPAWSPTIRAQSESQETLS